MFRHNSIAQTFIVFFELALIFNLRLTTLFIIRSWGQTPFRFHSPLKNFVHNLFMVFMGSGTLFFFTLLSAENAIGQLNRLEDSIIRVMFAGRDVDKQLLEYTEHSNLIESHF